ncbi:MAG TPA: hypothetical protein VG870_12935 [Chitinophagaceae bacterium]|nr:hypothetical protein [Chitinophagaceae bacterium]
MNQKRHFWVTVTLFNLCLVALYGFTLRAKFLFPIAFVNYRDFLSAHSHFAFGGWVGLSLMVLFVYGLLPEHRRHHGAYQGVLAAVELTALGMAITFPFQGYAAPSFTFSTLFLMAAFIFCGMFARDILRSGQPGPVILLALSSLTCFVLSTLGTLGITYVLLSRVPDSLLYRDSLYTFLHFQYNGFFTLGVFAVLAARVYGTLTVSQQKNLGRFAWLLSLSVPPTLFLSLLWHPHQPLFRLFALVGSLLMLGALYLFLHLARWLLQPRDSSDPLARKMLTLSMGAFVLKILLQLGMLHPGLAHAIFGNRPAIIGFLHLVFLGLVTFFILSMYIDWGELDRRRTLAGAGLLVFSAGILLNEIILMVQGLGILFQSASFIYPWLLWGASAVLLAGSLLVAWGRFQAGAKKQDGNPGGGPGSPSC